MSSLEFIQRLAQPGSYGHDWTTSDCLTAVRMREFSAVSSGHRTGPLTVLAKRRRWICQLYLGYWSLAPLQAGWLNDRNEADIVCWATTGE
jgi:hypothetical protein